MTRYDLALMGQIPDAAIGRNSAVFRQTIIVHQLPSGVDEHVTGSLVVSHAAQGIVEFSLRVTAPGTTTRHGRAACGVPTGRCAYGGA